VIDERLVREFLRVNEEGRVYHRESQELEFKEQFNLAALADYYRDFAAFGNNRGGYLIFGVQDRPRVLLGMSAKSIAQFEKIDPQVISGHLLNTFSCDIHWDQSILSLDGKCFGVFRIAPVTEKPIIAAKDEGKDNVIKSGAIYYRYGGRTQLIQGAELQAIITHRLEQNNAHWLDLLGKIGKAGPQNAAVLDMESGLISKDGAQILVVDEKLVSKLKFIKEGQFREKQGAPTLKLVGDVSPVDQVEVIKRVHENLTKSYPLSAMELAEKVKAKVPGIKRDEIWKCISENDIKGNSDYSAYNLETSNRKITSRRMANCRLPRRLSTTVQPSSLSVIYLKHDLLTYNYSVKRKTCCCRMLWALVFSGAWLPIRSSKSARIGRWRTIGLPERGRSRQATMGRLRKSIFGWHRLPDLAKDHDKVISCASLANACTASTSTAT